MIAQAVTRLSFLPGSGLWLWLWLGPFWYSHALGLGAGCWVSGPDLGLGFGTGRAAFPKSATGAGFCLTAPTGPKQPNRTAGANRNKLKCGSRVRWRWDGKLEHRPGIDYQKCLPFCDNCHLTSFSQLPFALVLFSDLLLLCSPLHQIECH